MTKRKVHYWVAVAVRSRAEVELPWPAAPLGALCGNGGDIKTSSSLTAVTCAQCLYLATPAARLLQSAAPKIPDVPRALHTVPPLATPVKFDPVEKPAHYNQGGIECIDALKVATMGLDGIEAVCTANAIKYLWRWKRKNGVEDIKKAQWYLARLVKELEAKS